MILRCKCTNSAADALYGLGFRPHLRLQTPGRKFLCSCCYYVRSDVNNDGSKIGGSTSGLQSQTYHHLPSVSRITLPTIEMNYLRYQYPRKPFRQNKYKLRIRWGHRRSVTTKPKREEPSYGQE